MRLSNWEMVKRTVPLEGERHGESQNRQYHQAGRRKKLQVLAKGGSYQLARKCVCVQRGSADNNVEHTQGERERGREGTAKGMGDQKTARAVARKTGVLGAVSKTTRRAHRAAEVSVRECLTKNQGSTIGAPTDARMPRHTQGESNATES